MGIFIITSKKQVRQHFYGICTKRDNYRCVCCKTQIGEIFVHHITDRNYIPNGGYVKENGITLCETCHQKAEQFHINGGKAWIQGYHPNELYAKIKSSHEEAVNASEKLSRANYHGERLE